jgi:hypothetical protein
MTLEQVFLTLKNEYNSGIFFIEGNRIGWIYKSEGVSSPREAEDRWLSFLGAKLTAQEVIRDCNFRIVEKFEINNRIGFFIEETDEVKVECPNKKGVFSTLFK